MHLNYLKTRTLSARAMELIQFDVDSIRQVIAGQHAVQPEIWLADPDQYEKDGRVFRDSQTYRLLAYSQSNHILYASDGCNACSRQAPDIRNVPDIPQDLLERLVTLTG
jgi:hypothetical protein